ncbi:MAG: hypothetical protein AB7N76_18335 [Planctomycetota bacterium]
MRAALLACTVLLALAGPAAAADEVVSLSHVQQRAFSLYSLSAPLPPAAARAREAWLCRDPAGPRLALGCELADGRVRARLRTARILSPGRYRVALCAAGQAQPLAVLEVQLGTPAEAAAAEARLDGWYRGALRTFRELTATLERRGRYHSALALGGQGGHEGAYANDFLERSWTPALLGARMDLLTFRRRMLLPPRPELLDALEALAAALVAQRDAWSAAILERKGQGAPLEQDLAPKVEAVLKAGAALGPEPADWAPGPLAELPRAPVPGETFRSQALGFELAIPAGAEVRRPNDPVDRVVLAVAGSTVIVQVRELPDDRDAAALIQRLEVGAWEGWDSYVRLRSAPLPDGAGLVLDFKARLLDRATKHATVALVHQRTLFPPGGRRVVSLLFLRPDTKQGLSDELLALEQSFRLVSAGR